MVNTELNLLIKANSTLFNKEMQRSAAYMEQMSAAAIRSNVRVNTALNSLNTMVSAGASIISSYWQIMSAGLVMSFVGFGALASQIMSVEMAMKRLEAVQGRMGGNETDSGNLIERSKELYDVAARTGTSFETVSQTMYTAMKTGKSFEEAMALTTLALAAGTTHGGNFAKAIDLAVYSETTFMKSTLSLAQRMDFLHYSATKSILSMEDFDTVFKHTAASADALGVSFEEMIALSAALSQSGIRVTISARGLRTMFLEMNKLWSGFKEGTLNEKQLALFEKYFKNVFVDGTLDIKKYMEQLALLGKDIEHNSLAKGEIVQTLGQEIADLGLSMRAYSVSAASALGGVQNVFDQLMQQAELLHQGTGDAFHSLAYSLDRILESTEARFSILKSMFMGEFLVNDMRTFVMDQMKSIIDLFLEVDNSTGQTYVRLSEMSVSIINMIKFVTLSMSESSKYLEPLLSSVVETLRFGTEFLNLFISTLGVASPELFTFVMTMMLINRINPSIVMGMQTMTDIMNRQIEAANLDLHTQKLLGEQKKVNLSIEKHKEAVANNLHNLELAEVQLSELQNSNEQEALTTKKQSLQIELGSLQAKLAELDASGQTHSLQRGMLEIAISELEVKIAALNVDGVLTTEEATQLKMKIASLNIEKTGLNIKGDEIKRNDVMIQQQLAKNNLTAEQLKIQTGIATVTSSIMLMYSSILSIMFLWTATGKDTEKMIWAIVAALAVMGAIVVGIASVYDWSAVARYGAAIGMAGATTLGLMSSYYMSKGMDSDYSGAAYTQYQANAMPNMDGIGGWQAVGGTSIYGDVYMENYGEGSSLVSGRKTITSVL